MSEIISIFIITFCNQPMVNKLLTTFAASRSAWVLVPPFVLTITVSSDESEDGSGESPETDTDEVFDSNEVDDKSWWSTTWNSEFIKKKGVLVYLNANYDLLLPKQGVVSPVDFSVVTVTVRFPACKSSSNTSASTSVPDSSVKCSSVSSGRFSFWMTKKFTSREMEKLKY